MSSYLSKRYCSSSHQLSCHCLGPKRVPCFNPISTKKFSPEISYIHTRLCDEHICKKEGCPRVKYLKSTHSGAHKLKKMCSAHTKDRAGFFKGWNHKLGFILILKIAMVIGVIFILGLFGYIFFKNLAVFGGLLLIAGLSAGIYALIELLGESKGGRIVLGILAAVAAIGLGVLLYFATGSDG